MQSEPPHQIITLEYSEQDYLKNNAVNCVCLTCLVEIFPFHHMNFEDGFKNECQTDWQLCVKDHNLFTIHMILIGPIFMLILILTQISISIVERICKVVDYIDMSLKRN